MYIYSEYCQCPSSDQGEQVAGRDYNLSYDGNRLVMYDTDGNAIDSWRGVSGIEGYQSPEYQHIPSKGPIPEGLWSVNQADYQEMKGLWGEIHNVLGYLKPIIGKQGGWVGGDIAWGRNRIWLQPLGDTNTYGRSGFSIHGGDFPGSAGCIDLCNGVVDFSATFLQEQTDMKLLVKYPGE